MHRVLLYWYRNLKDLRFACTHSQSPQHRHHQYTGQAHPIRSTRADEMESREYPASIPSWLVCPFAGWGNKKTLWRSQSVCFTRIYAHATVRFCRHYPPGGVWWALGRGHFLAEYEMREKILSGWITSLSSCTCLRDFLLKYFKLGFFRNVRL